MRTTVELGAGLNRILGWLSVGMVISILSYGSIQAREFKDAKGRVIEAELVGATHDGKVEIERGGKKFVVPISMFSVDDQTYIKDWLEKNPSLISYKFRYYTDVGDLTSQNRSKAGALIDDRLKIKPKELLVDITNLNSSVLEDIKVEVTAVVEDAVDAIGGGYTALGLGSKKEDVVRTQFIQAEATYDAIAPGGRAEIEFDFDTEFYVDKDFSRVDGSAQDRVLGVWIRIYQGDIMISEEKEELHSNFRKVNFDSKRKATPGRNVRSKAKAPPR